MRCTTDTLPPQGLLQCHITIRLPDDFINSIILIKMHPVVGEKKKSHIQLNFHRIQESRKILANLPVKTMWRNKFVSTRASPRGPRVPRVEARHVCVRQARFCFCFLLSFTQLKRIKVCFFFFLLPPNIITGYEMSHSGV